MNVMSEDERTGDNAALSLHERYTSLMVAMGP